MKTRNTHFLTVLFLAAVMSLASCQKEAQPEPASESDFAISVAPSVQETLYKGDSFDIPFTITKGTKDDYSTKISISGATVQTTYNGNSGTLRVNTVDSKGSGSVIFENSSNSIKVDISFETYYLNVSNKDITLPGEKTEYTVVINTNLPVDKIAVSSENDWLETGPAFKDNNGNACFAVKTARNETNAVREGSATIRDDESRLKAVRVSARQDFAMVQRDDAVSFVDKNFMECMIEIADADGDRFVSFEEALQVKEIDIKGRKVKDLTGLDAFKNVWKFDAQNNDIEDATILKELHSLYWLDLKGNKNLKTFDVTGCTLYFQHCEFEVTDNLVYYTTRQQVHVTNASDLMCEHSRHVIDTRQTTDWSDQDETVLIRQHTEGKGYPIILTGISYLDIDMQDGSFMRMMNDMVEVIAGYDNVIKDYAKYIDFYAVKHKATDRNRYFIEMEDTNLDNPKMEETFQKVKKDQVELFEKIYAEFFPDADSKNEMFPIFVEVNPSASSMFPTREDWGTDVLTPKSRMQMYYLHRTMSANNEKAYEWKLSTPVNLTADSLLEYLKKRTENLEYLREFFETNVKN